jgi:uncharacterized protein
MKQSRFLTAEWRKLILANYVVDPSLLLKYLPAKTELDFFNDRCYASLVGFMFENVKLLGVKIPFHVNFPEVNLRFYVRIKENNLWKRGVVFIDEIVPKPAISLLANRFFYEHYRTMRMEHKHEIAEDNRIIEYRWKYKRKWNFIRCDTDKPGYSFPGNSEEEFITQHFWGYTALPGNKVAEYQVEHPAWKVYPVNNYSIECDFGGLYGEAFNHLSKENPASVILAEGSPVMVYNKRII